MTTVILTPAAPLLTPLPGPTPVSVTVAMTSTEKTRLLAAAKKAGMSASAYARVLIVSGLPK